ncbi:MAG: hypothetical protein ACUVYA_13065 [Planctomycetota bacterium]
MPSRDRRFPRSRGELSALFVLVPAALFLAPAALEAAVDPELLRSAVRSPSERAGDLDALAAEWVRGIGEKPGDLAAELLARRLAAIRPGLLDERALVGPLEELLGATPGPGGIARQVLVDTLSDLYRRAGREEDRRRIEADRGFVLEWLVAGPFGKGTSSLLERPFPPEEDQVRGLDLSKAYRDGWQEIRWRKAVRERPVPRIEPLEHVHPDGGIVYLLAQVRSDEERVASLHRGSSDGLRVWVNGTLVATDDPSRAFLENRRATAVRLAKGWNRVLAKARGNFWLRFADRDGSPFPPGALAEETQAILHPLESFPDPLSAGAAVPSALEAWTAWVEELERSSSAPEPGGSPIVDALLGLAILQDLYARDDLAVRSVEKAAARAPEDPFVRFREGEILRGAGHYPPNVSKNRAQQAYESALAKDPDFVPAYGPIADFLLRDEQYLPAIAKVREGLARAPRSLPLLLQLKTIHERQAWETQVMEVVREIERIAPHSSVPPGFWGERYRRLGNAEKALEAYRAAFERDRRQVWYLDAISSLQRELGDLAGAESAIRQAVALEPDRPQLRSRLVQFLADAGRLDEALALARAEEARRPFEPEAAKAVGELLLKLGDAEGSRAAYARALALEPGDLALRRYLESLREAEAGEPRLAREAFWAPYDERLEDWMAAVPAGGPLVEKAASILVLDISVVRFERDGSSAEFVRQAYKLLSEESKEDLARASVGDEVIELRTISPSGEVFEPVPAEGKRSFVMPGLVPGAFIEYAYRDDRPAVRGRPVDPRRFYFQDARSKSPFLLSRYVLILPEGLDLAFVETKIARLDPPEGPSAPFLAKVHKRVELTPSGETVVVYETRDAPRLEPEPLMPAADEYIPNVLVLGKRTWSDIAGELQEAYRRSARLTPELRDKAREIAGSIEDPLERAKALYRSVNDLVASESGPGEAVGILLERSGNRTVLFKALLDAAGVPSSWAYLRPREEMLAKMDWSAPTRDAFVYPYVRIELEGREPLHVSLAQRRTPFGLLPEQFEGGKALLVEPVPGKIAPIPAGSPERAATGTEGALELEAGLSARVDLRLVSRAFAAFAQKDLLRTLPPFQKDLAVRGIANRLFPGAAVEKAELRGLDDPDEPFVVAIVAKAPRALERRGDEALFKPVLQPAQMVRSFCGAPRREHPLHLRSQVVIRDAIRVRPDPDREIAVVPADTTLASPLGTYALSFRKDGADVDVRRELTLLPGRLSTEEFPAFVEFCRKIDAAEGERLILRGK